MSENENILDVEFFSEKIEFTDEDSASGWKRFANNVIDTIIIYISLVILILVISLDPSENNSTFLIYPILLVYSFLMEYFFKGKTLGKFITMTRVVDVEGNPPTIKMAFIRSISRFIPFDGLSFLGSNSRGWHDKTANSYVITDKLYRVRKT